MCRRPTGVPARSHLRRRRRGQPRRATLLAELAERLELTHALGWRAGHGQTRRHHHQAAAVLRDLAVMLADGGDCLSDLAVLRDQPELFGPGRLDRHRMAGGRAGRP